MKSYSARSDQLPAKAHSRPAPAVQPAPLQLPGRAGGRCTDSQRIVGLANPRPADFAVAKQTVPRKADLAGYCCGPAIVDSSSRCAGAQVRGCEGRRLIRQPVEHGFGAENETGM